MALNKDQKEATTKSLLDIGKIVLTTVSVHGFSVLGSKVQ